MLDWPRRSSISMSDGGSKRPKLDASLRAQVHDEIIDIADVIASYARSIAEGAYRREERTVLVHLQQLTRAVRRMTAECDLLMGKTDGENVAGKERSAGADRQDQPAGDGVARGKP